MSESTISQDAINQEIPTPKQFRANFKEIFDAETTFGLPKAAREELLETVEDIIKEYLNKGSRIVYLHGKLKDAGYTGSRKELSEWLVAKGLWVKRELREKEEENEENLKKNDAESDHFLGNREIKNNQAASQDVSKVNAQNHKKQLQENGKSKSNNENSAVSKCVKSASTSEHSSQPAHNMLSCDKGNSPNLRNEATSPNQGADEVSNDKN